MQSPTKNPTKALSQTAPSAYAVFLNKVYTLQHRWGQQMEPKRISLKKDSQMGNLTAGIVQPQSYHPAELQP